MEAYSMEESWREFDRAIEALLRPTIRGGRLLIASELLRQLRLTVYHGLSRDAVRFIIRAHLTEGVSQAERHELLEKVLKHESAANLAEDLLSLIASVVEWSTDAGTKGPYMRRPVDFLMEGSKASGRLRPIAVARAMTSQPELRLSVVKEFLLPANGKAEARDHAERASNRPEERQQHTPALNEPASGRPSNREVHFAAYPQDTRYKISIERLLACLQEVVKEGGGHWLAESLVREPLPGDPAVLGRLCGLLKTFVLADKETRELLAKWFEPVSGVNPTALNAYLGLVRDSQPLAVPAIEHLKTLSIHDQGGVLANLARDLDAPSFSGLYKIISAGTEDSSEHAGIESRQLLMVRIVGRLAGTDEELQRSLLNYVSSQSANPDLSRRLVAAAGGRAAGVPGSGF